MPRPTETVEASSDYISNPEYTGTVAEAVSFTFKGVSPSIAASCTHMEHSDLMRRYDWKRTATKLRRKAVDQLRSLGMDQTNHTDVESIKVTSRANTGERSLSASCEIVWKPRPSQDPSVPFVTPAPTRITVATQLIAARRPTIAPLQLSLDGGEGPERMALSSDEEDPAERFALSSDEEEVGAERSVDQSGQGVGPEELALSTDEEEISRVR